MQIGEYDILQCADCGVQSTFPLPSPERLRTLYATDYYGGADAARFRYGPLQQVVRLFRWRRARMLRRRLGGDVAGRRVLDVGCGRGDIIRWLQRWGADVHGTEASDTAARTAGRMVGSDRVFIGDLADAKYPPSSFDCITLWHVLEHVRRPDLLLSEIGRLLRPGGFAYIEVPNAASWSARRFGSRWLAYDIPKHLFHFSPASLNALAKQAGLTSIGHSHFSFEYSPVTLLQTMLSTSFGGDALLFRRLTTEATGNGARAGLARRVLEPLAAAALAVPALVISGVLGWSHSGDTFGVYLTRTTEQGRTL